MIHSLGGVRNLYGELLDLGNGLCNHRVAFVGLLVGSTGRFAGFFGIARHFLHRRGHFVHGSSHLIGLDFLAVNPGAGLLGDGRQLFRGAGNLGDAIANPANQLTQAYGHVLDGLLQLPQLITALSFGVMGQVTGGDVINGLERAL